MQGQIDAPLLVLLAHPQAHGPAQDQGDDRGHHGGEDHGDEHGHRLGHQETGVSAVEQARPALVRQGEEADQHGAQDAGGEVHADDVERIVEAEAVLEVDRERAGRTGDQADHHGPQGAHIGARGRDGDQSRDDPGRGADRGRPAAAQPLHEHPAEHAGGAGGEGVHPDQSELVDTARRAPVEPEPAEPEQGRAEHGERDVVRPVAGVHAEAVALAQQQREHEGGHAGADVHHEPAGEVEGLPQAGADGAVRGEEPAAPHHVGQRGVDDGGPDGHEDAPRDELEAVGHRAGDEGDRDDREGGAVGRGDEPALGHRAGQPEVTGGVPHHPGPPVAAGHPVDPQDPDDADEAHRDEGHHDHVERGLRAGHAAVEDGQSGCHEQDHRRARHHPHCPCVQDVRLLHGGLLRSGPRAGGERPSRGVAARPRSGPMEGRYRRSGPRHTSMTSP